MFQIRKWKLQDQRSTELKSNVTFPNGNVTKQGGAPFGNKNALKIGEDESIFFETLSDEEKDIYSSLNDDP
ncbi:hypothetical protein RV14_GL002137 [Enterococcus ratti]|uniref:Uncharacterized protein n=1 Tax=Enterococcus ratti TaxID=150033 RepID=A0A1L8WPA6_9ENTE|nr:hypothetical protein RV14_GL002137 [Enterococcus ratti]